MDEQRVENPLGTVRIETYTGTSRKWTAIIEGPDAERATAEMVATLYDASLEAFVSHDWLSRFPGFRRDQSNLSQMFSNLTNSMGVQFPVRPADVIGKPFHYPRLLERLVQDLYGYQMMSRGARMRGMALGGMGGGAPAPEAMSAMADSMLMSGVAAEEKMAAPLRLWHRQQPLVRLRRLKI